MARSAALTWTPAAEDGRRDPRAGKDVGVIDVVFVLLTVGLFAVLALLSRAVERL